MNPINLLDLQWYESQVMADTPDGGGLITGRIVPEGNILGIFPNISSQQLVTGGVNIRQLYAGLFSPDTNTLSGAGVVIIEPPEHEAVNVLLFDARPGEVRSEAEQRIESYLIPGVQTTWRLLQDHPQGQAVLTLWALPETAGFQVGDTLILDHLGSIEPGRIERINARTTTRFSDASGVFELDVLELILTRGIEQDLPGEPASRFTANNPVTAVKRTTVSQGAHYYGIAAITQPISVGDLSVQVASLEAPIVPATTAETPIVDSRATLSRVVMVATGAPQGLNVVVPVSGYVANEPKSVYLGSPFMPGSLVVAGSFTGVDDGKGLVNLDQPGVTATCNYETGEITLTATNNGQLNITLTATAAAPVAQSNQTRRIPVTPQSRASTYVLSMIPFPAPGSVTVDYRALGRWYRLTDRGDGVLQGQLPNEGSGSVNFATGSAAVNFPIQPDVGSEVIYSWGTGVQVSDGRGEINVESPEIRHQLAEPNTEPGTVSITYDHNGNPVTITDDGQGNLITAGAVIVGRFSYPTSEFAFRPDQWPDVDASIDVSHDVAAGQFQNFQPTVGAGESGSVALSLGEAVRPRSVRFEWLVENQQDDRFWIDTVAIVDDGVGGFIWDTVGGLNGQAVPGAVIDYVTGNTSFPTTAQLNIERPSVIVFDTVDENGNPTIGHQVTGFVTEQYNWFFSTGGTITARYKSDGVVDQNRTESIATPAIEIDLSPDSTRTLAINSVRFVLNGRTYVDRAGVLVHSVDPLTNAGTAAGMVNYQKGTATITDWVAGNQNLTLTSLGLSSGVTPVSALYFRTDSAPNKQGSLSLRANVLDTGELLQGSADINGLITGDRMLGRFDAELGIVSVRFGEYVPAAGNELEWWYQADQVQGNGMIWKPVLVVPGSAFFNAVAFSSIPVPSFILGLDPILLPQTGRVPIFQSGDIVLVHRLDTVQDAAPVPGEVVLLDLPAINWVRVTDANGVLVASDRYTVDDVAVGLRWMNPLDLSQYTAPFTIQGFYYVQALVNEAQINGQISLNFPLPYDLPADGKTYLSSKLPFNPTDLSARATNIFTQETWTGEWLDGSDGSVTAGQFDDVNYPPMVTNQGAITERWRLQFASSNTVNVIGEQTGQVATGVSIFEDIAPINPAHGVPFFVIPALGFSQGFVQGNVLRIDTVGAHSGVWFLRSTQPSTQAVGNDGVTVALIGDGDPA